jgi:hypothetical protein
MRDEILGGAYSADVIQKRLANLRKERLAKGVHPVVDGVYGSIDSNFELTGYAAGSSN